MTELLVFSFEQLFLYATRYHSQDLKMGTPTGQSIYPHENAGPQILGATLTVTIVALITMAVRLYVRIKMIRNVGWDVRRPE